jgi:DegV family protein with EDD domain
MSKIAIVTDSDASLPLDVAAKYNIRQVPITVHFGEETFDTTIELTEAEMFERIDREGNLPTTSAPSPGKFAEAYQAAFDEGAESVVCLCVSSEVSATYAAALNAIDLLPGKDISVIDTRNLSMGQGFMALAAAEAAAAGASKEEIVTQAMDVGERSYLFAALSTLKYLAMSGRVGHLAAGMAGMLNIRPILTIQNGKLEMLERIRTKGKSWNRVLELTEATLDGKAVERMAVIHSNVPEEAKEFESLLRSSLPCPDEILVCELTAGLSVHSGAGMVGVCFVVQK